jgi:hypothetical protein
MALNETLKYANSIKDSARKPKAFWIDLQCQPRQKYIEKENRVENVEDPAELKLLMDQDVSFH